MGSEGIKKNYSRFLLIFSISATIISCSTSTGEKLDVRYGFLADEATKALSEDEIKMLKMASDFSLNFGKWAYDEIDSSFVISPLSMTFLLGMLSAGADGDTREEILNVFCPESNDQESLNSLCRNLLAISRAEMNNTLQFELADIVVADNSFPVLDSYKRVIGNYYDAMAVNRDFSDDKSLIAFLDNWISDNTHGLITHLIDELPEDCCTIIMNSLYYKGSWKYHFSKSNTKDMYFFPEDTSRRLEQIMSISNYFDYYEDSICQSVNLPYDNDTYYMRLILPKENYTSSDIMIGMNSEYWASIGNNMKSSLVSISMPKFKTNYNNQINKYLSTTGIVDMFSPSADFRNMSPIPLYFEIVQHIATINVNEYGTEAAAVSAAIGAPTTPKPGEEPQPIIFNANHPFMFAIAEKSTDAILFIGCYR